MPWTIIDQYNHNVRNVVEQQRVPFLSKLLTKCDGIIIWNNATKDYGVKVASIRIRAISFCLGEFRPVLWNLWILICIPEFWRRPDSRFFRCLFYRNFLPFATLFRKVSEQLQNSSLRYFQFLKGGLPLICNSLSSHAVISRFLVVVIQRAEIRTPR